MADTFDDLIAGLQNYVVSPLNAFGLGGYVFDIPGEARAQLATEITDHYTEDNKAVQDHVAIKPKRITLRGYVGELTYSNNGPGALGVLQEVTQKLTVISGYLPTLSAAATQAQQALANPIKSDLTLNSVAGAIPGAANIYGLVKNTLGAFGNQAHQQNAYNYFNACREQVILMGIQTPWEFLTNMAVETVEAIQSEDTIFISDFSVTFKQMRFASTQSLISTLSGTGGIPSPGGLLAEGPCEVQSASSVNQGIVPGMSLPSAALSGLGPLSQISGASSFRAIAGIGNLFQTQ